MVVTEGPPFIELADQLDDAPFDEVADAFEQLHALECAVRAGELSLVRVVANRGEWADDGATCLSDWVSLHTGSSRSEANELVRVASALEALPALSEAFGQGRLSWRRLCLLTKFVSPDDDAYFAEHGSSFNLAQLQAMARAHEQEYEVVSAFAKRSVSWFVRGQQLHLRGVLPVDLGAVVTNALERISDSYGPDPVTGLYADHRQSHADALVELASQRLVEDGDSDRATVVVEVDSKSLSGEGLGDISSLGSVPSETVRRIACDSRLQIVTVKDGESIGVGRTTRTIPHWLSRRLKKRDQGCRFPGCTRTRWTQGHHIQHWSHDGPTDMDNLVELCEIHHHFIHERHWTIEGNPNGRLDFVRPDGTVFSSACPPLREDVLTSLQEKLIAV